MDPRTVRSGQQQMTPHFSDARHFGGCAFTYIHIHKQFTGSGRPPCANNQQRLPGTEPETCDLTSPIHGCSRGPSIRYHTSVHHCQYLRFFHAKGRVTAGVRNLLGEPQYKPIRIPDLNLYPFTCGYAYPASYRRSSQAIECHPNAHRARSPRGNANTGEYQRLPSIQCEDPGFLR